MADETTPFFEKYRKEVGAVYRIRPGFDELPELAGAPLLPALSDQQGSSASTASSGSSGPSASPAQSSWSH